MNRYSPISTTNSYSTTTPRGHHRHHQQQRHSEGTSAFGYPTTSTSTQPPFRLYSAPSQSTIGRDHSIYTTTTTAAAGDHRILPPPRYPSSCSSGSRNQRSIIQQQDPSVALFPQTPPPSRAPRHSGGCIVSPPAPLRITNHHHHSDDSLLVLQQPQLNYEPIGPAHLKIYRLMLPLELQVQLDPIVAQAEEFSSYLSNGWHTDLYSLTKQDIALLDIPGMSLKIRPIFDHLCHAIRTLYGRGGGGGCHPKQQQQQVVVDKNQPHILKYSVDSGHTGVELHHDRCDVTANLALSRSGDYCGGGTYFPDTGSIIKLNHGECLLHPGSLVHGGMEVTKGTRYLMVTFAHLR